jgi:hypothetical protein
MEHTTRISLGLAAVVAGSLTAGCSGASGGRGGTAQTLPENTGAIVAQLVDVPSDVLCVDISTSDYQYTPEVRVDVVPGSSTTVQVGPLAPGYVALSGRAYDVPCYMAPYGGSVYPYPPYAYPVGYGVSGGGSSSGPVAVAEDAGVPAYDAGPTYPTWVADYTSVNVTAGQVSQAELRFHQLGSVDVNVTFDNCDPGSTDPACTQADGGWGVADAGYAYPVAVDAAVELPVPKP